MAFIEDYKKFGIDNNIQALILSLIGNPVKIGDGPAAVSVDERCFLPLSLFFIFLQ